MTSIPNMEPMIPSESGIAKSVLPALALDLERKAAKLAGMVNPITAQVLEAYMRVINSYYSNLIEGNSTHPRDIRKAMQGEYSEDPARRDLQQESLAHVHVQAQLAQNPPAVADFIDPQFFSDIHRMFYAQMPKSLRVVSDAGGNQKEVIPGAFRQPGEEVMIGRHVPPGAEHVMALLARFADAYKIDNLYGHKQIIAAMAAHHRFTWIHPFLDGNGRVSRLHTDLFLKAIGLGACGIWCVSRGLARNNEAYKAALARADFHRQGDLDGRGELSEKNLIGFCEFMITTAIDQVEYMSSLLDLQKMVARIQIYFADRNKGLIRGVGKIKPEASLLIEQAFTFGEFARADRDKITGLGTSVSRKLVQQLKEEGLLTETSSRSPLRWAIPDHAERYFLPELFPTF